MVIRDYFFVGHQLDIIMDKNTMSNHHFLQKENTVLGAVPAFLLSRTVFIHCTIFAILAWFCLPNLGHDMLENYAWGQTFEWGSFKHPPLFSWITRWWFMLWPTTTIAYYALSYLNDALALLGILCLSRQLLPNREQSNFAQTQLFLFLVLLFCLFAYPYNLYAVKFNADTILFSLWPWTTVAFLASLDASDSFKKWLWTLLFSVLAAASILGKYFSVVLLFTLFIISIVEQRYRAWYKTPFPYACLALFLLLLTPHIAWEVRMDFPFRTYTSRYLSTIPENNFTLWECLSNIINFSLSGIYYFVLSWTTWLILRQRTPKSSAAPCIEKSNKRVLNYLCFLPISLIIVSAVVFNIHLMERWATSVWFALPILMANLLSKHVDLVKVPLTVLLKRLTYFWAFTVTFLLVFTLFVATYQAQKENRLDYAEANKEMAVAIAQQFEKKFPGKKFNWLSGFSWPDHPAALAFYLPNHPRAVPFFPDQMPALVNPHATWNQEYGAIICGKNIKDDVRLITDCINRTHAWLASKHLPINEEMIAYHAQGWRYFKTAEKQVVVFWIMPSVA